MPRKPKNPVPIADIVKAANLCAEAKNINIEALARFLENSPEGVGYRKQGYDVINFVKALTTNTNN